jgi:hypothetical protein
MAEGVAREIGVYREQRKKRPASQKQNHGFVVPGQGQLHTLLTKQGYATQSEAEPKTHTRDPKQVLTTAATGRGGLRIGVQLEACVATFASDRHR